MVIRLDREHRSDHRLMGIFDAKKMIFTRVSKEINQ